jgi:hypothetical protein
MTGRAIAAAAAVMLGWGCGHEAEVTRESRDREAYVRALAEREGLLDAWLLTSRGDVILGDGLTSLEFVDDRADPHHRWYEVDRTTAPIRGVPRRWMGQRVHVRVRGGATAMRLEVRGRANLFRLFTRPRVTVTFDGLEVFSELTDRDGNFAMYAEIPASRLHGWSDVFVTLGSIHEPFREPAVLQIAELHAVSWEPVAGGPP